MCYIVVWLGVVFWFLFIFVSMGVNGIVWFVFNFVFFIILIVVMSFVCIVFLYKLIICFLVGGLVMGMDFGLVMVIIKMMGENFFLCYFIIVFLEEFFKLGVVVFIVWKGSCFSFWIMGVSDLFLMGVVVGVGFGFVEDLFMYVI